MRDQANTKRSREELIQLFMNHFPHVALTDEVIEQWLAHVDACGGYENTAVGGGYNPTNSEGY